LGKPARNPASGAKTWCIPIAAVISTVISVIASPMLDQSAEPDLVHLKAQHEYRDRRRALDQPCGEANMTLDDIRVGLVDPVLIHGANESSSAG
jgi:hypothetical protein